MSKKAFLDAATVNFPLVSLQLLIHCLSAWHIHYHHYFLLLFSLVLVFCSVFFGSNYIFWKELNVCIILKPNFSGTALCLFLCFDKQGCLFCGLCAGKCVICLKTQVIIVFYRFLWNQVSRNSYSESSEPTKLIN